MQKILISLTLIVNFGLQSCNLQTSDKSITDTEGQHNQAPYYTNQISSESPRISKAYDSNKIENHYPFLIYKDGTYMIAAEIESKALYEQYLPIFEKYNYTGNGYTWEGLIRQILQKKILNC
jgi:hypothetical protein